MADEEPARPLTPIRLTARRGAGARAASSPPSPEHQRLVEAVRELASASNRQQIVDLVRRTSRALVHSDGATFVLRDGDACHYVDEDAIGPLWKGQKFPMSACISGWAMIHKQPVVVEDIYADPRIPHGAYRSTFVKSLVMVPIRSHDPVGAIGTYWATPHRATDAEVALLQALADSTSVAMENVSLLYELDARVAHRTSTLATLSEELEAFASSTAHDLRSPLAAILANASYAFAKSTDPDVRDAVGDVITAAERMRDLISRLLSAAKDPSLRRAPVDLGELARELGAELALHEGPRTLRVQSGLEVQADPTLARFILANLLGNAWKFTRETPHASIEVGRVDTPHGPAFFVRDEGVGFDPAKATEIFQAFGRAHDAARFEGTGVGLSTVARFVERHGGRAWAESQPGLGATFYFTLAPAPAPHA